MINNEMREVSLLSFSTGKNEYGQRVESTPRAAQMVIKNYLRNQTTDIRYAEATDIGLTYDDMQNVQQVIDGDTKYQVLYCVYSRRLNQVFLKKLV